MKLHAFVGMHTLHSGLPMSKTKITIALNPALLLRLDEIVASGAFPSRSQAVEAAIEGKLARMQRSRLTRECAKFDPDYEKVFAEEGMGLELEKWPVY